MKFANAPLKYGFEGAKKNPFGIPLPELGISEFLRLPNFGEINKRLNESKEKAAAEEAKKEEAEQLEKDAFNRQQLNKDMRNLLMLNTGLREFEANREAKRNMNFARQYLQMASLANEAAARRRLMEDQFSPTKISQQRLRAQQGEAALMTAVANQTNAAVNMARSGINPRGRAGGA
tara:strand:+ start:1003 stop:1533 length:531 start_codon:yes stop_codon:yes gene_type:complete